MQSHIASLLVGLAVGAAYGVMNVRSPAPPVIALLGLLGMLGGEQLVTWLRPSHAVASSGPAAPAGPAGEAGQPGSRPPQ